MGRQATEKKLRDEILQVIIDAICAHYDLDPNTQIEKVGTATIALPLCDEEGTELYPTIKIAVPRGTRNGEGGYIPYDGHEAAIAYKEEKESAAHERAVKKAMKAAEKGNKKKEKEE